MPKYRVSTGDFTLVIIDKTSRKAADSAIGIHHKSNHPSLLGLLTLVEVLNYRSIPTGEEEFFTTESLLIENTSGMGLEKGQYSTQKNKI